MQHVRRPTPNRMKITHPQPPSTDCKRREPPPVLPGDRPYMTVRALPDGLLRWMASIASLRESESEPLLDSALARLFILARFERVVELHGYVLMEHDCLRDGRTSSPRGACAITQCAGRQ